MKEENQNPVLESTRLLIESPRYVHINEAIISQTAHKFAQEELELPKWDAPVYPKKNNKQLIDFVLLANSINFAFTDFDTKNKFSANYNGIEYRGAFGMLACLKKALDRNIPILDAEYLKKININEMQNIFQGNIRIPMFIERLNIFKEVGRVLSKKHDSHFHNLVEKSNNLLFNNGKGLVETLVNDFNSFNDSVGYKRKKIIFNKRAQLAPAILYARFKNKGDFQVNDINKLTVFADYVLPKGLRDLGILNYAYSLAKKIDLQELIPKESRQELEIRASTIHASDRLINQINSIREFKKQKKINALNIDYKLWKESRKGGSPHHLTKTIAY